MLAFMLFLTVTQLRCTVLVKMKAPKGKFLSGGPREIRTLDLLNAIETRS